MKIKIVRYQGSCMISLHQEDCEFNLTRNLNPLISLPKQNKKKCFFYNKKNGVFKYTLSF